MNQLGQCPEKAFKNYSRNYATNVAKNQAIMYASEVPINLTQKHIRNVAETLAKLEQRVEWN